jgi:hypothetical protein
LSRSHQKPITEDDKTFFTAKNAKVTKKIPLCSMRSLR